MLYPISPQKAMSITRWNVAPTLFNPKNIRLNANVPYFMQELVLSLLGYKTRTLLYPE